MVTMIIYLLYFLHRRSKNKKVQINSIIVLVYVIIILFSLSKDYVFYPVDCHVNYRGIMILFVISYLLIYLCALIRLISHNSKRTTISLELENLGWENYVKTLKSRILLDNKISNFFSLGIASPWGSGKTSFLKMLEKSLDDSVYIVKFNPWNSHTEKQITQDFFYTIKDSLLPYYRGLEKPMTKYSRLLIDLEINKWTKQIAQTLTINGKDSLSELRDDIEICLNQLEKKVIVLIDDLDRLKGKEILEIFKLIRNSANFENIIYVVAYDKEYVSNSIMKEGITNSELFIEKLFSLEVTLPKFEKTIYLDFLEKRIIELIGGITSDQRWSNEQVRYVVNLKNKNYIVLEFLSTFRAVERFSELLTQNMRMLAKERQLTDINYVEFFLLELIHYSNIQLYDSLANNPEKILEEKDGLYLYNFEKIKEESKNIYGISKDSKYDKLLTILFPSTKHSRNSIKTQEYFPRYFSYRLMTNQISIYELVAAIKSSEEDALKFIETLNNTKYDSLLYITKVLTEAEMNDKKFLQRFLLTLVEFSIKDKRAIIVLRESLKINKIKIEYQNEISNFIYSIFLQMSSTRNHSDIAEILRGLYGGYELCPYNDYFYQVDDLVIKNEGIKELAEKNFDLFVKQEEYGNLDIFDSTKSIGKFVSINTKISHTYDPYSGEKENRYENIVFERIKPIIEHMVTDEFKYLITTFFDYAVDYEYGYSPEIEDYEIEKNKKKIISYFNSTANYKSILDTYSKIDPAELETYYKRICIIK